MVKSESKRIETVPAEYETVTERVQVKAESKRLIEVPATYENATETYDMEPATTRVEVLQPKYETVTERVEVKPASTKWVKKKADANCLSANPDDCLVWCLVETPAEYQTITKRVNKGCDGSGVADAGCTKTVNVAAKTGTRTVRRVKTPAATREEVVPAEFKTMTVRRIKTPATSREVVIPAEYKTVSKQVLKTPATVREEEIPAEYTTVSKQMLKTPATFREEVIPAEYKSVSTKMVKSAATTRTEAIPAEYATVTKRRLVKPGGFTEWREVLCGEKVTGYTIRQIQDALTKAGYEPGPSDNVMGTRTKTALTKFQKDKGLPVGNLDFDTLKALGVNY
ncbi:MAG: peptidoglycan-binding protein [Saprospiraceae bacterium]|nr:peptidoglycan-binding protein [Saprospiraceae bacterium]